MKKLKHFVVCSIFIFCFFSKVAFQADAAISKKVLFNDTLCWLDTFKVLNRGYYIFTTPEDIEPDMFLGDIDFYIKRGEQTLNTEDFTRHLPFDSTYLPQLQEIITSITEQVHEDVIEHGVALFTVHSSAVFYTGNSTVEHAVCEYLEYDTPSHDTTIAGGMTHIVNVDHRTSLEIIKSRYTATDNVDGDITKDLWFDTNYNENSSPIGTYFIMASVYDNEYNYSCAVDLIIVKDFVRPNIFLSSGEIVKDVHTPFTSAEAKSHFSFSDNNTSLENLKIFFEDHYNDHYDVVGNYSISAYAIDQDGNKSETITLRINIVDKIPPTITLKVAGGNRIIADHVLSNEEILALLQVSDNYDTIASSEIQIVENTCTGEQGREYQIKVEVLDQSGNKGESIFQYYLTDTTSPIICVKDVLYIEAGKEYTNEQIIQMLKEANLINSTSSISNITTTLLSSDVSEETYEVTFEEVLEDGTVKSKKIQLKKFVPVDTLFSKNQINYHYLWFLVLILPLGSFILWIAYRKTKCRF